MDRGAELLVLLARDVMPLSLHAVATNVALPPSSWLSPRPLSSAPTLTPTLRPRHHLIPSPTSARPSPPSPIYHPPSPQEFLTILDKSKHAGSSTVGGGGGSARRFSGAIKKAGATIYKIQGAANSEHSIAEEEKVAYPPPSHHHHHPTIHHSTTRTIP